LLTIQITCGGFTAGLKAGHVSDTWPLMFPKLITPKLFNSLINIFETLTDNRVIHRWFAFIVLIAVIALYFSACKHNDSIEIRSRLNWLLALAVRQIGLGILTVILKVQIVIVLAPSYCAYTFALAIYFLDRFRTLDAQSNQQLNNYHYPKEI
jgi:heme a synthase